MILVTRIHNILITVLPFLGCVYALYQILQGNYPRAVDLGILGTMWLISGLGITVGYHRLLTHHSFKTTRLVKIVLVAMGCIALQGPPITWVSIHRQHHENADLAGDPHSPWLIDGRLKGLRGLWYAHIGWMFQYKLPNPVRYAPDLIRDKDIMLIQSAYLTWVVLSLTIPSLVGYLADQSWTGMSYGFLWGCLVRLFLVNNIIWSVNSICHYIGNQPFKAQGNSKNNFWLAIPSLGESWHNNHHAFPNSALLGLQWWQFDPGYWLIFLIEKLGLVQDLKQPTQKIMEIKKT